MGRMIPFVEKRVAPVSARYMSREKPGHTLRTTAVVNEAYLRLVDVQKVRWQSRPLFRDIGADDARVLTDFARARNYQKRGGAALHVSFDEALAVCQEQHAEIVAIDDALLGLAALDPRKAR